MINLFFWDFFNSIFYYSLCKKICIDRLCAINEVTSGRGPTQKRWLSFHSVLASLKINWRNLEGSWHHMFPQISAGPLFMEGFWRNIFTWNILSFFILLCATHFLSISAPRIVFYMVDFQRKIFYTKVIATY